MKAKELSFIVGSARSGTTILAKILNAHPSVHGVPEANFLVFFLEKFSNKKKFSSKDIDQVFEQIALFSLSHPWIAGWTFDISAVKELVLNVCTEREITFHELCEFIYSQFKVNDLYKDESYLLLDKNPSYTLFVNHLRHHFPDSKFIWIVRDYRAVALSLKQNPDLVSSDLAFNVCRWKLYNKRALKFSERNPKQVHFLTYENFVLNFNSEMEKITSFLNLEKFFFPISENTNEIKENTQIASTIKDRFKKKYSDLSQPLNSERLSAWKEELTKEEILISDALCGDLGKKFNYEMHSKISFGKKWGIKLRYCISIFRAYIHVKKDDLIYYAPIKLKLKRLKKRYSKLGLLK